MKEVVCSIHIPFSLRKEVKAKILVWLKYTTARLPGAIPISNGICICYLLSYLAYEFLNRLLLFNYFGRSCFGFASAIPVKKSAGYAQDKQVAGEDYRIKLLDLLQTVIVQRIHEGRQSAYQAPTEQPFPVRFTHQGNQRCGPDQVLWAKNLAGNHDNQNS